METADFIQLGILIVLIITAYIAIREIIETKNIHSDTLLWSKRNKTIDVLNEFRKVIPHITKTNLSDQLKNPNQTIPLQVILSKVETEPKIESELGEYLNHHEGLAIGIDTDLYDEELVLKARRTSFFQTWIQYKEYVDHRRKENKNPKTWKNLERLVIRWGVEDYINQLESKRNDIT